MLLMPFGDDVRLVTESDWKSQFGNLSLLMNYMNAEPSMNIKVKEFFIYIY